MSNGDLLDAREAMSMLGINENDLQTLVARGDLRAFRSAGTMKFRRDDVMSLKSEKGTEPTIIIPSASQSGSRTERSGILPTVGSASAPPRTDRSGILAVNKPPSRVMPKVGSGIAENATGEIVLDDIELAPMGDDAANTQHVTVQGSAITDGLGGATVMEPAATGEMTLIEHGVSEASTGPAAAVTGSGRRRGVPGSGIHAGAANAPAMSRVRAAVGSNQGVSMATSKRTQAVYQVKSASPIWTFVLILNSVVLLLASSVVAVMMTTGSYDKESKERIIPPFLSQNSQFKVYPWMYDNTPGVPMDKKPNGEFSK